MLLSKKMEDSIMPMIEVKTTVALTKEKRDILKSELGKAISIMGKTESYLMISLEDKIDLYFGGKKLQNGAFIQVKVLGNVNAAQSNQMSSKICEILQKELSIPGSSIYITYSGFENWGWNGSNF